MKRPEKFNYFAPGRVNLIGEHIDYNGGCVMPFAIDAGTYLSIRPNNTDRHVFYSENFPQVGDVFVEINNIKHLDKGCWVNFPLGIIREFEIKGFNIPACDFYYYGNLASGAGLSSSASIELVTAVALNDLIHSDIDRVELIKMSKSCENNFVGLNCGIMDQFIVGLGKENCVMKLNCNTLDYLHVDFILKDLSVVVINSNKLRKLSDSKYNERFAQCCDVLEKINKVRKLNYLCDLSVDQLGDYTKIIGDDVLFKRFKHVVSENERVSKTAEALKNNDIEKVGELMFQSHESLKNDYEVTGFELDTLAESSMEIEGVVGARMTGAGFGGCAIAIVENRFVDKFQHKLAAAYENKTCLKPSFYIVKPADCAKKI